MIVETEILRDLQLASIEFQIADEAPVTLGRRQWNDVQY
jgi:hypothetical protein